jgi:hypothetical protein
MPGGYHTCNWIITFLEFGFTLELDNSCVDSSVRKAASVEIGPLQTGGNGSVLNRR